MAGFLKKAGKLIEKYGQKDIEYYGDSKLLDFTRKLVRMVIKYTKMKTGIIDKDYGRLTEDMLAERIR